MILQDYLREKVKKDLNGLFLISGEEQCTYHQFYEEVNGYASGLKELGIERGDRVGLMLPNISGCSVIGIPDAAVGEKIKACVVSKKDSTLTEADIRPVVRKEWLLTKCRI